MHVICSGRLDPSHPIREMNEEHALLQTLLDQVPEAITIAYGPPYFPIVAASRQAEALMGFSRRGLLGREPTDQLNSYGLFLDDGITRACPDQLPLYRASRFGETVRNKELIIAQPDGTRINVLVDANPIKTPDGRVLGAVTCWRDVTEIKRAQEELRTSEAQLREASLRKDHLLAMVAHELRGPLSPIGNVVSVLQARYPGDPGVRAICDILERQVTTMARILDDLLDLSRARRGRLDIRVTALDLVSVIDQALEWNRALIDARGHQLTIVRPQLPILVRGDAVRLVQVVSNLLSNAAKYTDSGGRIWLSVERGGEEAIIRVRDTGRGLKASELKNIFDLFYQAGPASDHAEHGLGIGLSLVRSVVELHGGRVDVSSEGLGRGSEFVVRLPLLAIAPAILGDGIPSHPLP